VTIDETFGVGTKHWVRFWLKL